MRARVSRGTGRGAWPSSASSTSSGSCATSPPSAQLRHLDLAGKEQLRVSRLDPDVVGSQEDFSRSPDVPRGEGGQDVLEPGLPQERVRAVRDPGPARRQVRRRGDHGRGQPRRRAEDRLADRGRLGRLRLRGGFPQPAGRPSGQPDAADAGAISPSLDPGEGGPGASAPAPTATARPPMVADGLGGGRVLAAHAAIAPLGWLVFVERPAADAYAPLRAPIIRSVVIFVLGLGLSVLASISWPAAWWRRSGCCRRAPRGSAPATSTIASRSGPATSCRRSATSSTGRRPGSRNRTRASSTRSTSARASWPRRCSVLTALSEVGRAVSSTLDLRDGARHASWRTPPARRRRRRRDLRVRRGRRGVPSARDPRTATRRWSRRSRAAPLRKGEGVLGRAAEQRRAGADRRHHAARRVPEPRRATCSSGSGYRAAAGRAAAARGPHLGGLVGEPQGAGRVPAGGRRAAEDVRHPVGAGDPERPAVPRDRGQEPRSSRSASRHKSRVPRQHVARAAHAAQRDHRLLRSAARADVRRAQRQAGRVPAATSTPRAGTCCR